jgi:hypothetical protein
MANPKSAARQPNRASRSVALAALFVVLMAPWVHAQIAGSANIQGTVTDPSGAIMVSAPVVATNEATGVRHEAKTDASGLYSFPNLAIGTYSIEVAAAGFQRYLQTGIVLDVGSSIAVNVIVKIGQEDQTVQIRANALALQTEDVSLKQTVDEQTIVDMPLNGRQVSSLIAITGGAVNANTNGDVTGSKNFQTAYEFSIAGGQGNATDYRLDGADNNNYQTNTGLAIPFPDAVAQFSVETTAMDATSGLHPGGLVNVVTRSGSNQWHGTAFEFIRNNAIDSTNFFSTTKDSLHQNQFGGTFGGRIIRDKLFVFGGYQRLKSDQSQALTTAYVPTAANLTGDFSASDPTIQLVDPLTGIRLINNNYSGTPGVTWNPNASALSLDKYLPPTTAANGLVHYAIPSQAVENQIVTRVDETINAKNSLYGRYFLDGYTTPAFYSATNILLTSQSGNYERDQGFTIGETYIISQSLVNTFHATFTRQRNNRGPAPGGVNASAWGINVYQAYPVGSSVTASNKWGTGGTHAFFNDNAFSFNDDVSWIHGKHQIGFGGEYVRAEFNSSNIFDGNGAFTFTGIYSETGPAGLSTGGTGEDSNLDFLTGGLNNIAQSKAQQNALRAPIPSLYVMDTYHASPKLVLSAGLRWDPEYFPVDYFGRGSVFNYSDFLAGVRSTRFPLAPAGSLFYGDPGVPKAFTQNSLWQFSPRIGATYDPSGKGKMVIRVGAALVYDETNFFTAERQQDNPPWGLTLVNTGVTAPLNFTNPYSSGLISPNPFPLPFSPTSTTTFPLGSQYIILPTQFHTPHVLQYTVSLQREFGNGWQAQLDYIGNKSTHLISVLPLSQANYIPGVWGAGGSGCSPIATTGPNAVKPGAAGTPCSTTGNEASRFVLTMANPAQGPYYGGGNSNGSEVFGSAQTGTYNGMVAGLNHRLSSSFVLLTNYTWSHCIDLEDNGGDSGISEQNPANLRAEKGSCGFDYRNVFNLTVVASSHFSLSQRWLAQVVNGWALSPLVRAEDGTPFTVTSGRDNSLTDIGNDRPNVTNPSGIYTHTTIRSGPSKNAQYINAAAFTQNATGTFGDVGRNTYRGPRYLQTDLALNRSFPLHERLSMNFRLEAFNLLNHPDFAAPGSSGYIGSTTSLTSSTFGQVTSTVTNYGARIFQGAIKLTF